MSDSEDSTITYTEVSSPFEDLSDIGSLRVDRLPMMPEDPYAYVEAALQAPPLPAYVPEFVLEHVYPEFMPPEDDSDPEEDDEDPEEDPVDYPTDIKDEGEEESFGDEEDEDEDEDEDEEEHSAPADSVPPPVQRVTARM
nr:hypothetical protein [Tanacetum cinerariifolium]